MQHLAAMKEPSGRPFPYTQQETVHILHHLYQEAQMELGKANQVIHRLYPWIK